MKQDFEQLIQSVTKDIDFGGFMQTLDKLEPPKAIPFGIPSLDKMTGMGGAPRGLITEVYGPPSVGKTGLCLRLVAEAQKQNIKCCYIDIELALNREYAEKMGVDTKSLIIARPSSGEEAFELVESMSEKGVGLIIMDSVASLSATPELESDYDENSIGLQARLISKAMRKIIGCIYRNDTALVFVNQIRAKMATMPGAKTTTTSGGMAIPFYASLRLETARIGWIKEDKDIQGMTIRIKTEKNKRNTPQLQTDVNFYFTTGFDVDEDKLNVLVEDKTIERVGNTYFHNGNKIGNKTTTIEYVKTKL